MFWVSTDGLKVRICITCSLKASFGLWWIKWLQIPSLSPAEFGGTLVGSLSSQVCVPTKVLSEKQCYSGNGADVVCPVNDFFLLEQRNSNIHSARLRQPTTKEHKDRVSRDEWKKTKETGEVGGATCRPLRNRGKNFPLSTFKSMEAVRRRKNCTVVKTKGIVIKRHCWV